jgi:hypothetical protein
VFHASELKAHHQNDATLFPACKFTQPSPILTADGLQKHIVEEIVNSRRHGHGWQFLVRWLGYGREHNEWLAAAQVQDCKALNLWYQLGGDGPDNR